MKKLPWNLLYLKYFFDSVKHGSISKASLENAVSQSAISQAIGKLEESLDTCLIHHQPNRFKVSDEGQKLFEAAKGVFQSIQNLENIISHETEGKVAFASMHSAALALLPHVLKKAKHCMPSLEIEFRLGHTDFIKEWVKKGMVDFGIVLDNDDFSGFEKEKIYQGEYNLFVSQNIQDIKNMPFLISEERIETNLLKSYYRKKYGKDLRVSMEISSWEVIARLTEEGLGIGFFPDYIAKNHYPNLQIAPLLLETIPYTIFAIFAKNIPLNVQAKSLIDLFKNPS